MKFKNNGVVYFSMKLLYGEIQLYNNFKVC